MTVSKERRAGHLIINNSMAPPDPRTPKYLEADIFRCNHCERQILKDPGGERASCFKCDSFLCNQCALLQKLDGGVCEPWAEKIAKIDSRLNRGSHHDGKTLIF